MKLPSCRDADLHRPIYVLEGRCAESDDMGARPLFVQQLFTRLVHTHTCSISGAANMLIGVLFEVGVFVLTIGGCTTLYIRL